jgi:agmatinase
MTLENSDLINGPGDLSNGVYGVPTTYEEAKLIYVPVPWEATTSYGGGTRLGPDAILEASIQLDLFDWDVLDPWKAGMYWWDAPKQMEHWNQAAHAHKVAGDVKEVNALSMRLNQEVEDRVSKILQDGKIPALVGGDHSTPMGAYTAVSKHFSSFGILHIDAHSDTRDAYQGYTDSHASIMRNALERVPALKKLTQVAIRDFCDEEMEYVGAQGKRVNVFWDVDLQRSKVAGTPFSMTCKTIIATLPKDIWISIDIDGLDPRYCPHTGTPVPGGLEYAELQYLLTEVAKSGRRVIGFDLVEVAPNTDASSEWNQAAREWDANVGMRLLYKLSALTLASQGICRFRASSLDSKKTGRSLMGRGRKNKTQKMKQRVGQAAKKARAKKKKSAAKKK